MLYALASRTSMNLSVLHARAPLFTETVEGGLRNGYTLRFSNKHGEAQDFTLEVGGLEGAALKSDAARRLGDGRLAVRVDPDATLEVPVYVTTRPDATPATSTPITFTAVDAHTGERTTVGDHFSLPDPRRHEAQGRRTAWRLRCRRQWSARRARRPAPANSADGMSS